MGSITSQKLCCLFLGIYIERLHQLDHLMIIFKVYCTRFKSLRKKKTLSCISSMMMYTPTLKDIVCVLIKYVHNQSIFYLINV